MGARTRGRLTPLLLAGALAVAAAGRPYAQSAPAEAAPVRVEIVTDLGRIEIELDAARAPATTANFLRYVDGGFFDGGQFHRSARTETQADRAVKIEVVQASVNQAREKDEFAPIALERTSKTGLLHRDGTVSMARGGPDTATSSFFVCLGDQPSLDAGGARNPDGQGFAAFGRVVSGMDVVRRIHQSPAKAETLTPPVRIQTARRVR
jgi:peptidyl-prolyl cis-trans isomerase A (cyclophilin A)